MSIAVDDKKIDAIILTIQKYLVIETSKANKFDLNLKKKKQKSANQIPNSVAVQSIDWIKKGVNELIDISKEAYSTTINKIHKLTFKLQNTLCKSIKLCHNHKLGYHYSLKSEDFDEKVSAKSVKALGVVVVGRLKHVIRFRTKVRTYSIISHFMLDNIGITWVQH